MEKNKYIQSKWNEFIKPKRIDLLMKHSQPFVSFVTNIQVYNYRKVINKRRITEYLYFSFQNEDYVAGKVSLTEVRSYAESLYQRAAGWDLAPAVNFTTTERYVFKKILNSFSELINEERKVSN